MIRIALLLALVATPLHAGALEELCTEIRRVGETSMEIRQIPVPLPQALEMFDGSFSADSASTLEQSMLTLNRTLLVEAYEIDHLSDEIQQQMVVKLYGDHAYNRCLLQFEALENAL